MRTAVYQTSPTHLASDVTSQRCVTPAVLGTPDNVSLSKVTILDLSLIMSGTPDIFRASSLITSLGKPLQISQLNISMSLARVSASMTHSPHCLTASLPTLLPITLSLSSARAAPLCPGASPARTDTTGSVQADNLVTTSHLTSQI